MTRVYTNKEIEKVIIIIFSVISAIAPYGIRLVKYYYSNIPISFLYSYTDLFAFCFGIIIVILSEIRHIALHYKKFQVIIVTILVLFALFLGLSLYASYDKEIDKKHIEDKYVEFKIQNDSIGISKMTDELKICEKDGVKMFRTSAVLAGASFIGLVIFMFRFRKN